MKAVSNIRSGRRFGALASLAVAPVMMSPLGILMGATAIVKGNRYLGMLGVVASAVLGVTGYYVAGALSS